ncbi:hypothetical protein MHU86_25749 [Fragilaria crotonensis]|nr:hypothetical protein MHU86_25749 [Fragilaria crotonensis]
MIKGRVQSILNSSSIWKNNFPPEGGGNMRRWLRLQQDLFQKFRDAEHPLKGPVTLFDFADFHDAADAKYPSLDLEHRWRYSDDSVIGGFSKASLNLIQSKSDLESMERGETPLNDEINVDPEFLPFVRWKGFIDTRVGEKAPKRVAKSGFCSIRSPVYPFSGAVLSGKYNSLELTLRTDGRQYWINLYPNSAIPEDLFQIALTLPQTEPDEPTEEVPFQRVLLPFTKFLNTCNGRLRELPRRLDNGVDIKSIGFTLMDGLDGDFEFDLASIRAVNFHDGCILGEEDEGAPY